MSLNIQPVAGRISTGFGFEGDKATDVFGSCAAIAKSRVSDHTTSSLRKSSGLGGKPPRPVIINSLPFLLKAAQLEAISPGVFTKPAGSSTKPWVGSI